MGFESARADRISAMVFFGMGAAMTWGGFVMDRLEIRNIHPASIPGLVPMILGLALMLCAVFLYMGARRDDPQDENPPAAGSWIDFFVATGLSVVYALALVGNMPFALASGIYLALFTAFFLWRADDVTFDWRHAIGTLVFSVTAAVAISALFRYGFLVRLP